MLSPVSGQPAASIAHLAPALHLAAPELVWSPQSPATVSTVSIVCVLFNQSIINLHCIHIKQQADHSSFVREMYI